LSEAKLEQEIAMKSSLLTPFQLILALYSVSMTTCFTTQPSCLRPNTALAAKTGSSEKGRVKRALKKVSKKIGLDKKKSIDTTVVSAKNMSRANQSSNKYSKIDDVEERAFQILVDLGMVEKTK
jgi:hypothetical protein